MDDIKALLRETKIKENYPLYRFGYLFQNEAISCFKQKLYFDHLTAIVLSSWFYVTNNYPFIPGATEMIELFYKERDPLHFNGATHIKKTFKELGADYESFNESFFLQFQEVHKDLLFLSKKNYFMNDINLTDINRLFELTNKFNSDVFLSKISGK